MPQSVLLILLSISIHKCVSSDEASAPTSAHDILEAIRDTLMGLRLENQLLVKTIESQLVDYPIAAAFLLCQDYRRDPFFHLQTGDGLAKHYGLTWSQTQSRGNLDAFLNHSLAYFKGYRLFLEKNNSLFLEVKQVYDYAMNETEQRFGNEAEHRLFTDEQREKLVQILDDLIAITETARHLSSSGQSCAAKIFAVPDHVESFDAAVMTQFVILRTLCRSAKRMESELANFQKEV